MPNIKYIILITIGLIGAGLHLSCAPQTIDGGSGSETEAIVSGTIFDSDYSPADSVLITARLSSYTLDDSVKWQSISTITDKDGRYSLRLPHNNFKIEARDIRASNYGSVKYLRIQQSDSSLINNDTLSPLSSIAGRVSVPDDISPADLSIYIFGSNAKTTPDASGNFSITSVPYGVHFLKFCTKDNSFNVQTQSLTGYDTVEYTFSNHHGLLVDNFEDYDNNTNINLITGTSRWYTFSDRSTNGFYPVPQDIYHDFRCGYTKSGAFYGNSFHIYFDFSRTTATYALAGFSIGGKGYYDLSAMDSLVFYVKGQGSIRIELQTQLVLENYNQSSHFYVNLSNIDSLWYRCSIPSDSIKTAPNVSDDNHTWSEASHRVAYINFLAKSSCDLWLDDIYFAGMEAEDLQGHTD